MPQKKLTIKPETWVLLTGLAAFFVVWACYFYMPAETPPAPQSDLFAVYGFDRNCEKEEVHFYVKIPHSIPLQEKLEILTERISRFKFSPLPIKTRLDIRHDKKIAVIDLQPHPTAQAKWRSHYLAGSYGEMAVWITLKDSILQKEYEGKWIDGVEFLYHGKPFPGRWEHLDFSGTHMRDGTVEYTSS